MPTAYLKSLGHLVSRLLRFIPRRFVPHFLQAGHRRRRWALLALPAALATGLTLALVPAGSSFAATAAGAHRALAAAPAGPSAVLPVLTLKMNGKTIAVGGTLKSGAERIVSTVTDKGEASNGAEPTLVRLDPGASYAKFFAVLAKLDASPNADPNMLYGVAQIVYSTQANFGTSAGIVDLAPGSYAALDLGTNGKPPVSTFAVAKAAKPVALPKAGATISSIEFGFTGPTKIRDGEIVQWANAGYVVHMIIGIEASSLAGAKKIAADLKAGKDNAIQALGVGFFGWDGALSHGQAFETVVSQHPGYWVLACFMDTQDGREHTQLGMERVIQIVK
jgi:hypothetical protein